MENKINGIIQRNKREDEINTMSPLTWAYIGDSVYELFIRMKLVNGTKLKPHGLHVEAVKYVKAKAQADILKRIEKELTQKELKIVKRGRNAENHHIPKNATIQEYMLSTGLESLIGYLYLSKRDERLKEILAKCIEE